MTRSGKILKDPVLQDAWRLGGWHVTSGHAFERLVSAKEYAEAHPDYFSPKQKQPCLTQWSKHGNVAQTFSLPYRRFSTCQPAASASRGALPITNRRYSRLQICVTLAGPSLRHERSALRSEPFGRLRKPC